MLVRQNFFDRGLLILVVNNGGALEKVMHPKLDKEWNASINEENKTSCCNYDNDCKFTKEERICIDLLPKAEQLRPLKEDICDINLSLSSDFESRGNNNKYIDFSIPSLDNNICFDSNLNLEMDNPLSDNIFGLDLLN